MTSPAGCHVKSRGQGSGHSEHSGGSSLSGALQAAHLQATMSMIFLLSARLSVCLPLPFAIPCHRRVAPFCRSFVSGARMHAPGRLLTILQ